MYHFAFTVSAAVSFSLFLPAVAIFNASSRTNLATYYGQGPLQPTLLDFCQQSSINVIPLAFVNTFPAQGNGYPGTNFGNRCWGGTYPGPGYNGVVNHALDALQSQCPTLVHDIPICQSRYGKKILLSLGGAMPTPYYLNGVADGQNLADFLWAAFGPRTATWVSQGLPRPFDDPNGRAVEVDGFDFDIEFPSKDNSASYIALLRRLRAHFVTTTKPYLITGSPQCLVPDTNMGTMIATVQFDILWVQYYNTPVCSARSWITSPSSAKFSYDAWAAFLLNTASAKAKLYIGLLGSPSAATDPKFYLNPVEAEKLIQTYFCRTNFGGVMLWDATYAEGNINQGVTYYQTMKEILVRASQNTSQPCVQTTQAQSPTKLSTVGSMTSITRTTSSTMAIYWTEASASTATRQTPSISPEPAVGVLSQPSSAADVPNGISNYGICGKSHTCKGSRSGPCCSQWGFCGTGSAWCGKGCQPAFGMCSF